MTMLEKARAQERRVAEKVARITMKRLMRLFFRDETDCIMHAVLRWRAFCDVDTGREVGR